MPTLRKHSRKRDAIIACIRETKAHPSAETVYSRLRAEFPKLSLGTVYRNIALLREEGEIVSVGFVGGEERFDGVTSDHPHFVCDCCGAVIDVELSGPPRGFEDEINRNYGFEVSHRKLIYFGKCTDCIEH
ncbi:MAG: transcriptional repressor [Oscillospiraceae bacterium]|jgi:Fur family peroxide stress response transcriptional regulator|nr:transcriptional repressor [Oscillospiraceae bacterium]